MKIVPDGVPLIVTFFLLGIAAIIIWPIIPIIILGVVLIAMSLFCLYFFRDPKRNIVFDDKVLLSPADGTVLEIAEEDGKKALRIFLSVFNVHLQRSPCKGKTKKIAYIPGKYLPAMHPMAHSVNEKNIFTFESAFGEIVITQIAGIIARRVVAWAKECAEVKQGERIGFIKFGSQVDILVGQNVEFTVKLGDKVFAGETVIARIKNTGQNR
jgi:phosphatidylserine decarboxylase